MQFFGIFSIIFGLIVIAFPQFLAYLIGFFFLLIGVNIIFASRIFRSNISQKPQSWKVGSYEILKNKK